MIPSLFRAAIVALVIAVPLAGADFTIKLGAADLTKLPYIVPVVAPSATPAASQTFPWFAVGHRIDKEAQVSLFNLDAQGQATGMPVVLKLPEPPGLAERMTFPLSIAFHPSLPLLYAWQDVEALKGDPAPPVDPAWNDLDHLLIYSLDGPAPELLLNLCRGAMFHTGNRAGSIAVDAVHGRLYVPNLRFREKAPADSFGIGWFSLAADGLPIESDEESSEVPTPLPPEKAALERPARAAALRALLAAGKPTGAFRHTPPDNYGFNAPPAGAGFIPISRDVFIVGGTYGPVTWNLADRNAGPGVPDARELCRLSNRITGHPRLPILYASMSGYGYAHAMEHADGYLTLVPQVLYLNGARIRHARGGAYSAQPGGLGHAGRHLPGRDRRHRPVHAGRRIRRVFSKHGHRRTGVF